MGNVLSQSFPPLPTFTDKECPDLTGKVCIVTGGASGIGFQLVRILYQKNATVYIAGRSLQNSESAIQEIHTEFPSSNGKLAPLALDLSDLSGIKKSAETFISKEDRLDVLFNNAGIGQPPEGSQSAQGYDLQLGTNCLGPYLFTHLLQPLLTHTASSSPPASVRVCWAGSLTIDLEAPDGGIDITNLTYTKPATNALRYAQSKCGNLFLSSEFAARSRERGDGVVSLCFNPGNLRTPLLRHLPAWKAWLMNIPLYEPVYGAYTELWAGISPDVTIEKSGAYVMPWGRFASVRPDIELSLRSEAEGGTGRAAKFVDWCDEQCKDFM